MNTKTGTERRSLRHVLSSSGWNAINHARFSNLPGPTPEPLFRVESESPLHRTPEPPIYPPILPPTRPLTIPVSEGIKRTGAWLEKMAKRRQAAQATVKVPSESLESPPAQAASTTSPQSSIYGANNRASPIPDRVQETRIVPASTPKSTQQSFSSPIRPRPHLKAQVVVPVQLCVQTQMSDNPSEDHRAVIDTRSTESPMSSVQSIQFTENMQVSESEASSVDSVEPEQDQSEEEDDEVFEVERILNERNIYGEVQFLVKWADYPESSWISEDDCNCEDLIRKFRATRLRRPRMTKSRASHANSQRHDSESADPRTLRAERRAAINKATQIDLPLYSKRSSRRGRDPTTGKLAERSVSDFAAAPKKGTHRCHTVVEERSGLLRNVRANTARYSPRPAVVHTRWDEATGQIDWTRSAREERWRRITERGAKLPERIEPSAASSQKKRQHGRERGSGGFAHQPHIINRDQLTQGSQPSEQCTRHQYERCRTFVPTIPSTNYKTPPQRRVPIHIRFDDNAMPIKTSPKDALQQLESISPSSQALCGNNLREARLQEKRSGGPSLLRHEFSSEMSYKHAEALINQTRGSPASPERAFGFSLSSQLAANSVLLSIEKDDD